MQAPEVADLLSAPPGDTLSSGPTRSRTPAHPGLARGCELAQLGLVNDALAALDALRASGEIAPGSTDAVVLLATSIECRLARGDLGDALVLSDELTPYLALRGTAGGVAHHARGELASALNEPDLAAGHFATAGTLVAGDAEATDLVPWRAGAALAAVRLGRRPEAASLAREQLALADTPYARALALRTLATTDAGRDRVALLRRSRAALAAVSAGRLAAQVDTDLAGLLLLQGDPRSTAEALTLLRRAEEYAGRQELWPLQARVRRLLDRLGEAPRRVETEAMAALTVSERRVARLAADGLTNRQIAQELVVTVKAVEWHLSHVYRKLGIRSRTRLAYTLGATA